MKALRNARAAEANTQAPLDRVPMRLPHALECEIRALRDARPGELGFAARA